MKVLKRTAAMTLTAILSLSLLPGTGVKAAKKKLSVNKVYNTTARVKGKTKGKYVVKIKVGKKTYKAKASKKGNYSVKIPKQAAGKTLYVRAYKKGGKKYYTKKKFYVLAKTISVKKFAKTSKYIKGYARPKYTVKITINGKTYKKKASKTKGFFSFKMKKAAGNAIATIRLYNTKGKRVKTYTKKAYNTSSSSKPAPAATKIPKKTDPINEVQLQKDIDQVNQTGKYIIGENDGKNGYRYFVGKEGWISVGYVMNYMYTEADGAHAQFKANDGITLYFTVSPNRLTKFEWPTTSKYDLKLESGQIRRFQGTEFKELPDDNLYFKVKGYKNGKLILMQSSKQYLIAGYNDSMFQ